MNIYFIQFGIKFGLLQPWAVELIWKLRFRFQKAILQFDFQFKFEKENFESSLLKWGLLPEMGIWCERQGPRQHSHGTQFIYFK